MNLKRGWRKWLVASRFVGRILSWIVVSLFYFTIMLPFNLGVTLFGDPLKLKETPQRFWLLREAGENSLEAARRQF
jgi:hypothetical protein